VFVAGLCVPAGADAAVVGMADIQMTKEEAQNGEKETNRKTAKINILFHNRIPLHAIGQLTGGK
jgi:hypothetical protein